MMDNDINLNDALEKQASEYEAVIAELKLGFSIDTALMRAGAKNIKAARALISEDSLALEDNGSVSGLDEQIEKLRTDSATAFLFESAGGFVPYERDDITPNGNMTYSQLCEIYN